MTRRANGEGSLFWNEARQRWIGELIVDGKPRRVLSKTRTEARKRLDVLRRSAEDGLPATSGNMTVSALLDDWRTKVIAAKGLSSASTDIYDWSIAVLKVELGTIRLRALTVEQIEAAFARRVSPASVGKKAMRTGATGQAIRPLGRTSLKKLRSTLAQALRWAERRRLVAHNVALLVELPADAERPKAARSLTLEEGKRLLTAAADDRYGALWTTMLLTGVRPGEAGGLYWDDVDFDLGVIRIRRSLKVISGKSMVTNTVKSASSLRSLDAPKQVLDALLEHGMRQTTDRAMLGALWVGTEPLVFTTTHGTALDPSKLRRAFKSLTKKAEIEGDWHPHELRHSAASLLSAAGVPIEHISDMLGHSETRTTETIYRHQLAPSISAGKAPMESMFG